MVILFLSALTIGFSGAMMPGPLLTYTIRQALNAGPKAGFIIAAGHAVLELGLVALLLLGFDLILKSDSVQIAIGIIGGALLAYMGADMIGGALKNKVKIEVDAGKTKTRNMFYSGLAISAANPYFLFWWAVIGLGFLLQAHEVAGMPGLAAFYCGHILADFSWYGFVSVSVGKTRRLIKDGLYRFIIAALGCVLLFFGCSFIYRAIL